jgi:two-component sensor histidine kinase
MLARWSLRSKLVVLAALALLPVLGLAAWQARIEQRAGAVETRSALSMAAEIAVARYGEVVGASTRLLSAACLNDAAQLAASLTPAPADIGRCEAYLTRLLAVYPGQYSAFLVTDEQGVARCASTPTAVGMTFADRDIFQKVRRTSGFAVSEQISSRLGPHTVVPIALPIMRDGAFQGMCALGITLKALADAAAAQPEGRDGTGVAVIDRAGVSVGGDAAAMRRLPPSARMAAAIAGRQDDFSEYGQDGALYAFRLRAIDGSALFAVVSAPIADGPMVWAGPWMGFALVVLATVVALAVIWLGADRWCVRPLRYIQNFADKVARGEDIKLAPAHPWTPEMASVGAGVTAMAEAIASREAELRAGLEQRDHMLREIHHRVKNNLQMISSLLNLQAGEIRSPRIRRFFGDAQNRVLTLSILHRHLYERSSWSLVDFQQFISDLVRQISVGRTAPGRTAPRFHIRAPTMAVGPDTAIPIGLIVTEAVSMAFEHDFSGVSTPEIRIEAAERGDDVELVIEDNGVDHEKSALGQDGRGGFALTLVRGLAMQLGGEARIERKGDGSSRVCVVFPTPTPDEPGNA